MNYIPYIQNDEEYQEVLKRYNSPDISEEEEEKLYYLLYEYQYRH